MRRVFHNVTARLRAFRRSRRANVAITFALAAIPAIGLVGAAVDLSRANSVQAAMQSALDSTALMVSKNAASTSSTQLQTSAKNYFTALFTHPEVRNVQIAATYSSSSGSSVLISGSGTLDTSFMGILGIRQMNITGKSTAKWGSTRLRVALALDNTGSMADDGKMSALQTATKNLLSQLQSAVTTNGDVYVSIVPFSKDINAGSSNYNASWIDWTDWNSDNQTCTWWGCQTANHNTWNGCITDRGGSSAPSSSNYDQNVVAPGSSSSSKYPAEQYGSCPQQVMGLSYNWSNMTTLVNNMSPDGSTNQPIGLVWAWLSLAGGGPFSVPAMDSNYQYQQVIILLSDGLNTQDRWYGNGSNVSTSVDKRMYDATNNGAGTCANIKAAGITIYAIQVNTGGDPTSTLLQNCASSSDKFYMLTSANQIVTTFNTIGTNLTKLRIAQ